MDLVTLRALGTEPCTAAAPAGESVRYDTDFEALAAEIEKLTSVEQTSVDWNRVLTLSSNLLRKGKDLLVGSYLACGAFERLGYGGLGAACTAIQGLLQNFWPGLFPELRRLRARIAALDWLAARLEKVLVAKGDPGIKDREGIEEALSALQAIIADEAQLFAGEGPNLSPAIRALRSKLSAIPVPEEPKVAPAAQSEPERRPEVSAPPPAPPPPPPPPKADTAERVLEALAGSRAKLLEFAKILQDADSTDVRAYILRRAAVWQDPELKVDADKPQISGRIGDATKRSAVQAQLDNGEFAEALASAERLLEEHPLWLDLQLLTVLALDGLGRRYSRVREAVLAAMGYLLRRWPSLVEAADAKDQQIASPGTQVWLRNEVLGGAVASTERDMLAELGVESRKLVARGKLGEAIRMLTLRIDATASRRGRFQLRLDLARVCIEALRIDLAVPQLVQLEQEITHFSLEEWEPELAADVVRLLWQCCSGDKPAPSLAARGHDIYARLCRLDPAAAVSAPGPQGG